MTAVRNVTDGVEVHRPRIAADFRLETLCGLGPLRVPEWKFTSDEVTCEECKP